MSMGRCWRVSQPIVVVAFIANLLRAGATSSRRGAGTTTDSKCAASFLNTAARSTSTTAAGSGQADAHLRHRSDAARLQPGSLAGIPGCRPLAVQEPEAFFAGLLEDKSDRAVPIVGPQFEPAEAVGGVVGHGAEPEHVDVDRFRGLVVGDG